jgi:hypothetical protein
MDHTVEAIQAGIIDFSCIRVPLDFTTAGYAPDQANDCVTIFDQVAGHG